MSTSEDIPVVEAEPVEENDKNEEQEEKREEAQDQEQDLGQDPDQDQDHDSGESCEKGGFNFSDQDKDMVGEFVYSFGHGFVQAPIDGVREIVNTLSGSKVVPKVEVVKPPEKKEIATPEWQAQRVGEGCGIVASIVVIASLLSRGRVI